MDIFNVIRSGIFFAIGLVLIIFRVSLNNFKNNIREKLHFKKRNEVKDYIYIGIIFIIISIILFVFAITGFIT
jgi:hypothetical protein